MTRKKMVEALVEDQLSNVEQLVLDGDTQILAAWLRPLLTKTWASTSLKTVKAEYLASNAFCSQLGDKS